MRQSRDFSGAGRAVVVVAVAAVVEDSAFDGPVKLALLDMMPVVAAAVVDWDSSELIPLLLVVFESFDVAVAVVVGDVLVVVDVLLCLFVSIRVRGQYV